MMKEKKDIVVIIPSAGVGSRMGGGKAKQYCLLHGKTVLEHSLGIFLDKPNVSKIVVAVAENDTVITTLPFFHHPKIQWVTGGASRAESVLNALNAVQNPNVWVLVHDSARPCVKWEDIKKLIATKDEQGAILAVPVVDTLKKAHAPIFGKIFHTVDRQGLWQAQTPQFFPLHTLKNVLQQALEEGQNITDEASAMEQAGFQPTLVVGSRSNIKITYPEDLALAAFYLSEAIKEKPRV